MTAVSKKLYIDKLDDKYKHKSTYFRAIKMNPIDLQLGTYIEHDIEYNDKDPKFKVGDLVRLSKCNKYFYSKLTILQMDLRKPL